jgi:hypothetical protein
MGTNFVRKLHGGPTVEPVMTYVLYILPRLETKAVKNSSRRDPGIRVDCGNG